MQPAYLVRFPNDRAYEKALEVIRTTTEPRIGLPGGFMGITARQAAALDEHNVPYIKINDDEVPSDTGATDSPRTKTSRSPKTSNGDPLMQPAYVVEFPNDRAYEKALEVFRTTTDPRIGLPGRRMGITARQAAALDENKVPHRKINADEKSEPRGKKSR